MEGGWLAAGGRLGGKGILGMKDSQGSQGFVLLVAAWPGGQTHCCC